MSKLSSSQAARLNGSQSKGPTSGNGKARPSQNALKLGLDAKAVVLPDEDKTKFAQLESELRDEHVPSTPQQRDLVGQIIAATWRLRRLWLQEASIQSTAFPIALRDLETGATVGHKTEEMLMFSVGWRRRL
jgi:hypothetical protein